MSKLKRINNFIANKGLKNLLYVYICYFSYKVRFRLPFILHLEGENKVQQILDSVDERLSNSAAEELDVIIQEICKMCDIRIDTLVMPDV